MSAFPVRAVSARRAARHPQALHLVAADDSSFAELEALVATLPLCATGRIFVEVADASQIGVIDAPPRMTVTWLDRARRTGPMGSGRACARGEALTRAVNAWADEMLCDADTAPSTHILAGFVASADMTEHLTDRGVPASAIHTSEAYGLR
ncbi:SIP domain-containing protein [Microbacterium gorillae]|uniref:SIP domain-containing protein n=1 Tax=Microbacterium gorillae TaxID=1231063 RepID=UPI00059106E4|nr:SIP domain-containing protein [Microbacterium gorillae]